MLGDFDAPDPERSLDDARSEGDDGDAVALAQRDLARLGLAERDDGGVADYHSTSGYSAPLNAVRGMVASPSQILRRKGLFDGLLERQNSRHIDAQGELS